MTISSLQFDTEFQKFKDHVYKQSGVPFTDFATGWMYEQEYYKTRVRHQSLEILNKLEWTEEMVGSGIIAQRVVNTMELSENNLVSARYYGRDQLPYYKILRSIEEDSTSDIEKVLYDHFKVESNPQQSFERIQNVISKRYVVPAFLFFLKNDRKYLPISTRRFEGAFQAIGIDFKLSHKCSWENYQEYLKVIRNCRSMLEERLNEEVRLLDAHSFLWIIGGIHTNGDLDKHNIEDITIDAKEIYTQADFRESTTEFNPNLHDRNTDWDALYKQQQFNGRKAEEIVLKFEKARLEDQGFTQLADQVEDCSQKYELGYDVKSFNDDHSERHIEVKASKSNWFIITRNELERSKHDDAYWIYIVSWNSEGSFIRMLKHPKLTDDTRFTLTPREYEVSFQVD